MAETMEQVPELVPAHQVNQIIKKPLQTPLETTTNQTTPKTTKTRNPDFYVKRLNQKVDIIYGNNEYNTLDEDTRHKLDSKFYDKVVTKYYRSVAQKPPSKVNWMSLDRQTKIGLARSFQPNPLVNWVSHEEQAPDKNAPEMTSGERAKYYSAKILDSTLKYVDTANNINRVVGTGVRNTLREMYGTSATDYKPQSVGPIKENPVDVIRGKLNKYFESVESQVQHDLRTKIFAGAAGFIPDLLLFKGIGAGLKPLVGELEAGKIVGESLLQKAGGITKLLESTPVGRTAYRLMTGSLEGFAVDLAQGDNFHKAAADAPSWGMFNAAMPLAGKLIAAPFKASMSLYANMAAHTGAEFVINSMDSTIHRLEQNITEPIKDELIAKLDKANAQTLNQVAKEKYKKLYTFLTPDQKKAVTGEVKGILDKSFNNPAAHATSATVIETNQAAGKQAASDPVFAKQLAKAKEATKKVTGSEVLEGPAKEAKKQAEYTGRAYGTTYIANRPGFNIGRGSDKGSVRVTFPDVEHADLYAYLGRMQKRMSGGVAKGPARTQLAERLGITDLAEASKKYREQINSGIKDLEEGSKFEAPKFGELAERVDKNRIVPGAASNQSPEFLNNLLKQYESNIGFENPRHKLLAMWANKDDYPPALAKRIQEEMDEEFKGLTEKQVSARLKFLKTHISKLDATWEINPQGDKKRVFRSTELTPQKKTQWQKELDTLYNSTFGEK